MVQGKRKRQRSPRLGGKEESKGVWVQPGTPGGVETDRLENSAFLLDECTGLREA